MPGTPFAGLRKRRTHDIDDSSRNLFYATHIRMIRANAMPLEQLNRGSLPSSEGRISLLTLTQRADLSALSHR